MIIVNTGCPTVKEQDFVIISFIGGLGLFAREIVIAWTKRESMDETGKKHKQVAQQSPQGTTADWGDRHKFKRNELYKIPFELADDVFNAVD